MKLLIVESPTKAKTLQKFLKSHYIVRSSFGHIRDLPEKEFGVEIKEGKFFPKYVIPKNKRKVISELKKYLKKAKEIILATDEDREGEAIAWHLKEVLKIENPKRIAFHEITKDAIQNALKNPRQINLNLVQGQIARRVLDRIVGYRLSPLLWKKIRGGLSAGRVQSVALNLICEREKEIRNFKPEPYWTIEVLFQKKSGEKFFAILKKIKGETLGEPGIKDEKKVQKIVEEIKKLSFFVKKVEKKEIKKNPLPPFITSTLQQTAWQKLKFPAKFTMKLAQNLYEKGFITYHRTDSFNISKKAFFQAKNFIEKNFGKEYFAGFFRKYPSSSKLAQEAHEAIRPTFIENTKEKVKAYVSEEELKLYDLVWKRFLATQMKSALFEETEIEIEGNSFLFFKKGKKLLFDGFFKVYPLEIKEEILPPLKEGEKLFLSKIEAKKHFTKPPLRYSDASLIKTLEKYGIGRPSTYAQIISILEKRKYVKKKKGFFFPTFFGFKVNEFLKKNFPEILDIKFTAKMEEFLDEIAKGNLFWQKPLANFYSPFQKKVDKILNDESNQKN